MAETFVQDPATQDEFDDSEKAKMQLHLWRRLFGYVLQYKGHLAIVAVCGSITGGLEIIIGLVTKWLVDDIQANGADANLGKWALVYVLSSLMLSVVTTGFVFCVTKMRAMTGYDIRRDAFRNIQKQSFKFFDNRPVGWLMARLTSDTDRLTDILCWAFLDLIWGTTMMIALGIVMFVLSWKLALFAISILPFVVWVTVKFRRSILRTARDVRSANSLITGSYNEHIMGVLTSKSFVRASDNLQNFSGLTNRLYDSSVKNLTLSAIYVPLVMIAGSVATGIALGVGGTEFLNGAIIAGTLLAFMIWIRHFLDPTIELAMWFTEIQTAQASAERILAVMDAVPDIDPTPQTNSAQDLQVESIDIRNVSFEYVKGDPVLTDINLHASQGETVALVGPTGGGKTTLANILCRFYEPTQGLVAINGIDYRQLDLRSYRSQLGVVLQQAHVFSGSIFDNIRYGKNGASEEQVIAAARLAGAHDFIEEMENGYQTEAGAAGSRLSAGQKQLVSIARAILADPQILVLDEATSSVDTITEQHIQEGLENLFQNRICFVIAHRLSTIRNASKIAFIRDGRIVEFGTHQELLRLQGSYSDMYRQQSLRVSIETSFDLAERTRD